jgi:hypothetical protein
MIAERGRFQGKDDEEDQKGRMATTIGFYRLIRPSGTQNPM